MMRSRASPACRTIVTTQPAKPNSTQRRPLTLDSRDTLQHALRTRLAGRLACSV